MKLISIIFFLFTVISIRAFQPDYKVNQVNLGVSLMEIGDIQQIRDAMTYYGYTEVESEQSQIVFVAPNKSEVKVILDKNSASGQAAIDKIIITRSESSLNFSIICTVNRA